MKKSLIALTLAALPVAAMADVTLYGQIKAGVDISKVKTGDKVVSKKQVGKKTATEIADYGSRIGFKGHEHLGSNLNAIWQVEQKTSIAGTDSGFANRESFLGLEGGFGKVRAGNLNTALNDSSDSFDPWESGAANEDALQLGKIKRVDDRKVSVRYDTPVLGGFSASVQYQPRDNANSKDKYTHKEKSRDSYDLGLNYENSGFFGRYAGSYAKRAILSDDHLKAFRYNTTLAAGATYKDHQAHRLTAGYDANNLMVAVVGQYEGFKADVAGAKKNERTEVGATAAYRFGNVTPRVSYAHGFKAKEEGVKQENSAYNQVIVGADYDFSKRTSALVSAGWLKEGKGDYKYEKTAGTVGLRHKF